VHCQVSILSQDELYGQGVYEEPSYEGSCIARSLKGRQWISQYWVVWLLMELLSTILQTIRIECSMLYMTKPTPSVLRVTSLSSFKWEDVNIELQQKAPTLFAILKAAAQPTRSRQATPLTSMIAIRSWHPFKEPQQAIMCLLQSIVATVALCKSCIHKGN